MIPTSVIEVFERFGELLAKEANNRGFAPVDRLRGNQPSERHGGWDWTFSKTGLDMARYFTIGLRFAPTPVGVPSSSESLRLLLLETWAGADTAKQYVRRQVATMSVREDQLRSTWDPSVWKAVRNVMDVAEALTLDDLAETYDLRLKR